MAVDSCVILCGGQSSRLRGANGESKIFLPFGGKSLVAHNFNKMRNLFKRVFIACKDNQVDLIRKSLGDFMGLDLPRNPNDIFIIESPDIFAPIVGIISAFTQLQAKNIFFISCDCPFVSLHTIESLCESAPKYDIVFAKDSLKIHPLIAVWSAKTLPLLQDCFKKGDFRLQNIIDKAHSKALLFDKSEFFNINTKENYFTALEILRESRAKTLLESLANHANHT